MFQVWLSNVASCRDSNNDCRLCMRVYLEFACRSTHNFNFSSADLSIASPDFSFPLRFVYKIFFYLLFLVLIFSRTIYAKGIHSVYFSSLTKKQRLYIFIKPCIFLLSFSYLYFHRIFVYKIFFSLCYF